MAKRIAIYGQKQVKIELSQFLNFAVWISCSRKLYLIIKLHFERQLKD